MSAKPPYSRLFNARSSNVLTRLHSQWVLVGADGWPTAARWSKEKHRVFVLCPPGKEPADFDWSLLRKAPPPIGLVRCGRVDGMQLQKLITAILAAGSPRIYDLLADTVYQPTRAAA